jgi:hypothetical protein
MRVPPDYERQILALVRQRGVEPVPIRAPGPLAAEPTRAGRLYAITVQGWRPALDNELTRKHWRVKDGLKRRDVAIVAWACRTQGVPTATNRRRVAVRITNRYTSRYPDPLAPFKSLLDALVRCGALVDDSGRWCEVVTPAQYRRGPLATTIELTDLEG